MTNKSAPPAGTRLTDNEIVSLARYPILHADKASLEDRAFARLLDMLGRTGGNRMALVTWPTGVKCCVQIRPGDTSPTARAELIRVYRLAEAGVLGPVTAEKR